MSSDENSLPLSATGALPATEAAVEPGEQAIAPGLTAKPTPRVEEAGTLEQVKALARYMTRTEVHTYAFSVAAQVILSLFPFIVLLLTIAQRVFHSTRMVDVVGEMMTNFLPNNQEFVMRNMRVLAFAHTRTRVFSLVMLFITATGVFMPLEVALNSVWGVKKNRSYLANQVVSLGLALGVALLAMASIALSAAQRSILEWMFVGHTDNFLFGFMGDSFLKICAGLASVGLFFLIYWGLPNRKIPARAVLPTAIVMGVIWEGAKYLYILALPHLDFHAVYGPFYVSVGLMMWAFISGLLLLAGAYVSATRQALRETRKADLKRESEA
ncbi:YihY family inner membrane protein [Granulicella sp. 5B5]|uniref:YihY/virulence factor BrkB family protein n=1 Tax=Granulicella sp. 5B5 TaxID=1617967 RepID=UPI0015F63C61|nr:YihY/virulence factor BrkB family protein [Granulicella sp. 5B5]QMV19784.1 YihY family inner membrane protein [Granulicella sp. 5B5]